ncbi:dihydrofolate reductase [Pseudomonas phage PhiPA3]|uniref:dihydrofolate reductase n=1 Tax=Pseudomonas phage PhiPA3 TaxID=998086 RepID=F8SJN4_BPPA3|nr:dihydrofolate reductase [Pseudomonas phage PhiPA3]AEH03429.1 FolA [Pseudomonas phage PhiPA3]
MKLALIVAASKNEVIGVNGEIPWHIPEDFKWFKEKTLGHPVIMGRKTWESIGRPLPGRLNIVVSSTMTRGHENIIVVPTLQAGIKLAEEQGAEKAFVIGGERMYHEARPWVNDIYLTQVDTLVEYTAGADVAKFPIRHQFPPVHWRLQSGVKGVTQAERNPGLGYELQHWVRR